ncbi:MAG: DUF2877 domain-containing protein [Anaerolineales bacterium]|nr:DUF2877 domain-containing protein [Anaerolineales bacterium]
MTIQTKSLPEQIAASTTGTIAQQTLSIGKTATVMGNTSRGIFIKTEPKWVLFVSYEDYRGPMTVNLKGDITPLRNLTNGGLVRITPGQISIPKADLMISTADAAVWQPQPPATGAYRAAECFARMKTFAWDAYQHKKGSGLSGLLPYPLDMPCESNKTGPVAQDFQKDILSINISDLPSTTENINKILGRGAGLTPSGDDFLIGLLLTLNRWEDVLRLDSDLGTFNEQIVQSAYNKTTTLGANLIECAAHGLADERLINALDYLITGAGKQERILNELLSWGNSSGIDALVGMVAVMSAGNTVKQ